MGPLLSYHCMDKYVKSLETPEKVSVATVWGSTTIYKDEKKYGFVLKNTDSEFWEVLEFNFIEGRGYTKDDVDNVNYVAVITQDTREKLFNNEPAVGKTFEIEGRNFRVIGVVENFSVMRILSFADIYTPVTTSKEDIFAKTILGGFPGYYAMILAKDKSDFPAIKAELQSKVDQFEFLDTDFDYIDITAETYVEAISRLMFLAEDSHITAMMVIVVILISLFLLLPTINLVNLNVSRIIERASEIGIRKSFGASSMTLVGQFIMENIILTLIGGIIGVILTVIVLSIINDSGFIEYSTFGINYRILFTSLLICLFFGLYSGVYPAYKMSKMHPVEALRGGQS
jgi:putative ABC transport system permease protein